MKKYLRTLGLLLTAILPNILKRPVYRFCFGFRVGRDVKIGIALLDCAQLTIDDGARIAHGVAFLQCKEVRVGKKVQIGFLNLFRGGERIYLGDYSVVLRMNVINAIPENDCTTNPDSSFYLGYGAVVTAEHRIDFTDRVTIGRCSMLGGRNSSIWTHNRRKGTPVVIGDYCYLGSEIRMAPGARVPDCCIVGIGSLLTHPIVESYSLIVGVPARPQRKLTPDDYETIFDKTRKDLPAENYPVPTNDELS
jgi:acetyltransferase-like isoleucine patch superfamily enzyme